MRFDIVTLFPEWVRQLENFGVVGRAIRDGHVGLETWNPRDYTERADGRVDERPVGGGPGMVLQVEPLARTLDAMDRNPECESGPRILLAPDGERFEQSWAEELKRRNGATLVCGRYQGVDQRFVDRHIDACLSVGDFVLSGGELPAMMIVDAATRLGSGVLGDPQSTADETFTDARLSAPYYARPTDDDVPAVLLSGDHARIARWRQKQALGTTWLKRPDLLEKLALDTEQTQLLAEYVAESSPKPADKATDRDKP